MYISTAGLQKCAGATSTVCRWCGTRAEGPARAEGPVPAEGRLLEKFSNIEAEFYMKLHCQTFLASVVGGPRPQRRAAGGLRPQRRAAFGRSGGRPSAATADHFHSETITYPFNNLFLSISLSCHWLILVSSRHATLHR